MGKWIKQISLKGSGGGCHWGELYRCDLSVPCGLPISGLGWKGVWSTGFLSSVNVQPTVEQSPELAVGSGKALPAPSPTPPKAWRNQSGSGLRIKTTHYNPGCGSRFICCTQICALCLDIRIFKNCVEMVFFNELSDLEAQ